MVEADALGKLPDDYREVLVLRNLEHIPFDEFAAREDRGEPRARGRAGAARVLWKRAIERKERKRACIVIESRPAGKPSVPVVDCPWQLGSK